VINIKGDLDWRYHPTRGLYLVWISPNGEVQPLVPDVTFGELEIIAQRTLMMLQRIQMLMQPQAHIYLVSIEEKEETEATPHETPIPRPFLKAFENEEG